MTEDYPGLLTRWSKVNASMGGCFRFNEITAIHGASGSGKSYILNMIREDFCDKQLNHFSKPFKILSFSFEMSAADELIRTYSSKMKTSYSKLVSTETKITEEYFNDIIETSKMIEKTIKIMSSIKDISSVDEKIESVSLACKEFSDIAEETFEIVRIIEDPNFVNELVAKTSKIEKSIEDVDINLRNFSDYILKNILNKKVLSR
jgi:replicative DNA helicase